jgi:hypothetical protein
MIKSDLAAKTAIKMDEVEVVCPTCNILILAESNETEIYCHECKCIIMQLPICAENINLRKGENHGVYT